MRAAVGACFEAHAGADRPLAWRGSSRRLAHVEDPGVVDVNIRAIVGFDRAANVNLAGAVGPHQNPVGQFDLALDPISLDPARPAADASGAGLDFADQVGFVEFDLELEQQVGLDCRHNFCASLN
ncbi:MAG TPA: hypothetical protein VGY99_31930 [Candidatus Binataceae bacterium]|jgi:hypothetical protein|nr:hypothetical protein [Candidatus Binataceae bacterium]